MHCTIRLICLVRHLRNVFVSTSNRQLYKDLAAFGRWVVWWLLLLLSIFLLSNFLTSNFVFWHMQWHSLFTCCRQNKIMIIHSLFCIRFITVMSFPDLKNWTFLCERDIILQLLYVSILGFVVGSKSWSESVSPFTLIFLPPQKPKWMVFPQYTYITQL